MGIKNDAKIILSAEDRTKQIFDQVKSKLTSISLLSGAGLLSAAAGITAMAKSAAAFNDEMLKSAQSVGTNTENLSGLAYAAKLGGVEFEQLNVGLVKLAKTSEDFRDGLSTAVDAYNKIDLDPTKFNDTSNLFDAVAEKLSKLPDGAQKSAIAMELLGKSGAKLIPLMNGGAEGIAAAREEAEKFGLIISTETARQSEQFNDNVERMESILKGLRLTISNATIPAFVEITDNIIETTKETNLLYGALVGLETAFKIAFTGNEETRRAARIKELSNFISYQSKQLEGFGKGSRTDVIDNLKDKIKDAREEMRKLIIEQSEPYNKIKTPQKIELPEIVSKSAENAAKKEAEALAKLTEQFEKAVKPAQTQSETLQETLDTYGKLDPKVRSYLQTLVDQVSATEQLTKVQEDWNDLANLQRTSDDEALRQMEDLSAAEQDRIANMEDQAQAIKELFDPTLKLLNIQAEYDNLLNDGLITQEEYNYALKKAQESTSELADQNKKDMDAIKRAVEGTFNDARDSVVDFAFGADVAVSDMVENMLKSLAKLALQRAIFDPLSQSLDGILSGGGSSGGSGLGSLFSSLIPSYDVGTNYVPQDQLAMVHKGERIIPASQNSSGYGSTIVSVHVDATGGSVQGDSKKATELGRQIEGAVRTVLIKEKRPGGILA